MFICPFKYQIVAAIFMKRILFLLIAFKFLKKKKKKKGELSMYVQIYF